MFFLWTDVISASFNFWGNHFLSINSLNSLCKTLAETLEGLSNIWERTLLLVVAILGLMHVVNFFFNITYLNYFEWKIAAAFKMFLYYRILRWKLNLSIAFSIGSVKSYGVFGDKNIFVDIYYRHCIIRFRDFLQIGFAINFFKYLLVIALRSDLEI